MNPPAAIETPLRRIVRREAPLVAAMVGVDTGITLGSREMPFGKRTGRLVVPEASRTDDGRRRQ